MHLILWYTATLYNSSNIEHLQWTVKGQIFYLLDYVEFFSDQQSEKIDIVKYIVT